MRHAFTLIELLVVVTIIAILLAMLTPAVDRAIYQAELARCGAQQSGVALGALAYTQSNKQRYPFRAGTDETHPGNYYALHISLPFGLHEKDNIFGYDDRPLLRPYMNVNAMCDPLTQRVDLDGSQSGTMVFCSYNLWFGWKWLAPDPGATQVGAQKHAQGHGFNKLGQGIEYIGPDPADPNKLRSSTYHTLLGDAHGPWAFGTVWSAHQDKDGVWTQFVQQDTPWGQSNPAEQKSTVSLWTGNVFVAQPGRFDFNFASEDGSVHRYGDVNWNVGDPNFENRFDMVPLFFKSDVGGASWQAIPKR